MLENKTFYRTPAAAATRRNHKEAPATPLAELIRAACSRWALNECFQVAKNETGLDPYPVRGHTAWYRHITLSMAAAAFLTTLRRGVK